MSEVCVRGKTDQTWFHVLREHWIMKSWQKLFPPEATSQKFQHYFLVLMEAGLAATPSFTSFNTSHVKITSSPNDSSFSPETKARKQRSSITISWPVISLRGTRGNHTFTYGKLSLHFMGGIDLGFCERREGKLLTVCGKTEQEREEDVFILQFFCYDIKNRSTFKALACLVNPRDVKINERTLIWASGRFSTCFCRTFPRYVPKQFSSTFNCLLHYS